MHVTTVFRVTPNHLEPRRPRSLSANPNVSRRGAHRDLHAIPPMTHSTNHPIGRTQPVSRSAQLTEPTVVHLGQSFWAMREGKK
jgi:hypothetical protein